MRRALLVLLTLLLVLIAPVPAHAATKNAGIPGLTPYGGYLGNYLAPDGTRVYCIDSPLPWPSGDTSGPTTVDSLVTTWGDTVPSEQLARLNHVLTAYGQTDDPVQAAAVAAYVNAYTSGWARDLGAGYEAGAWYLNGDAAVLAVYDAIWADSEAYALRSGVATVVLDLDAGTLVVDAQPVDATGTVTLAGAVRTDTGESAFPAVPGEVVPISGTPPDDADEYEVSARADFSLETAAASVVLYTTPDQQRTIRGGAPGATMFSAEARGTATAPPRLAATGEANPHAALVAAGLLVCGALLVASAGIRAAGRR
ncbi:MAG: hypothetical protein BGO97_13405 [Micrococcales bacterium 70-64]|nr:hypothetical protein [Leifsonia sp.]ODU64933.1 MAG: hypothetical protein ABT06_13405 [Leifsonia sp. SCN 70-46]OJX86625.1 MAG: hypothetical protein BGO97_13405 [Micrococcales bacterium 70-64]